MREGWTLKKLGEVAQSELGKTLNSAKDKGICYPYLCAINVLWDKIDTTTLKETKFEDSELERYSVKKGDLLVCEGGDIGRAAIWDKEQPILYQNALHRLRFHDALLPRFCLLYLRCLKEKGILDGRYGKGVTIKHLVKSSLLSIPIPVPPLSEQQRIVSELDLLSSIIEKKKAQLKEYDQLAQSIFYDMFGDPVTNEKGWEVKKLGEVCEITSSLIDPQTFPYSVMFHVSPSNIISGTGEIIDCLLAKEEVLISNKYTFTKDMVLYSKIRPNLNKVATPNFDGICSADMYPLTIKPIANKVFIRNLLLGKHFLSYAIKHSGRARMPKINREALFAYNFPLPPLSLQQSFASKIEAIEHQKALVQQSIAETESLFNSRMDYYFD